jgi:hypothetical protein
MSTFASLASRTIKVTHNGDTRRGQLTVPADSTSAEAFAMIKATAAALFEISEEGLWMKYADEEGDLCTLTEQTISDLVAHATEGVLRLTLEIRSSAAANPDITHCEAPSRDKAPSQSASAGPNVANAPSDDALRLAVRTVLQKIPAGPKMMACGLLQAMDPATVHGLVGTAMEHLAAQNPDAGEPAQPGTEPDAMSQLLRLKLQLLSMDPDALKALLLSELQCIDEARNADSESSVGVAPPDFMQLIGAALSGKGIGKGCPGVQGKSPWENLGQRPAGGGQPPNPIKDLLGNLVAAKGAGKGNGSCPAAGQAPNPMQDLLGSLFDANGAGKGNGAYPAGGPSPNPMNDMLGAFFAAKGMGKGTGSCPCPMPENPTSTPVTTPFEAASAPPASDIDSSLRETFEALVEDLLSMGLVADKQMARELLTTHGDISTVVSILTGDQ